MACTSEFQELVSRNPFVEFLHNYGFQFRILNGYFVIFGIPYLAQDSSLKYGDWACSINLTDGVISAQDHQAHFRGDRPHDGKGQPLQLGGGAANITITEDLIATQSFSMKPLDEHGVKRDYSSFDEKGHTYLDIITAPAMAAYPSATPLTGIPIKDAEDSPLRIPDTLSSRYNINDVSFLLKGKKVAIIGLGGTGAYILDFVARTHLAKITLIDNDIVYVHNLFRMPGFIEKAVGNSKVQVLGEEYKKWHKGIEIIPEKITSQNVECLGEYDFVFVSVDDGPSRGFIVDWLSAKGIAFVDTGMGLQRSKVGLNGCIRITGTDRKAFEQTVNTAYLPTENPKDGEYRRQAQIAELNALNAALAVLRFKQHFKLFDRFNDAISYIFETGSFDLDAYGATK